MTKNMSIDIPIDTQADNHEDVMAIILDIMQLVVNKHYKPVTSVSIDGLEIFNSKRGFSKYVSMENVLESEEEHDKKYTQNKLR